MKPFFSIVVPCCDVEPYLRACLDSVVNQPFTDWECLLGVEESKDDTEKIAREYAAKDPRIKVFTGPRSGSCSASRNTGIDMATGEYIIFLDGDDSLAEGSLQRLHDKIAARPGADLYPCAYLVRKQGSDELMRCDNYWTLKGQKEMTGTEATLYLGQGHSGPWPNPMLQLSIFRKDFLLKHNLKCLHGLRCQDVEFAPRALFFAKRVFPLHEPYYHYRIRENSVQQSANSKDYFYDTFVVIYRSLFDFYVTHSKVPDFDQRVAPIWAKAWTTKIYFSWFLPEHVRKVPRSRRLDTLKALFADGFSTFDRLRKLTSTSGRIAGWWVRAFVEKPLARRPAEIFFRLYFALIAFKQKLKKH